MSATYIWALSVTEMDEDCEGDGEVHAEKLDCLVAREVKASSCSLGPIRFTGLLYQFDCLSFSTSIPSLYNMYCLCVNTYILVAVRHVH